MTEPRACKILLLGDLTYNFDDELRTSVHSKSNGSIHLFFNRVAKALRQEFASLPAQHQEWLPRFASMVDLVSNSKGMIGEPALRPALLCAYQISSFMRSEIKPSDPQVIVVGVCTGTFAAAAISSAGSFTDLAIIGVEAVLAAFRSGWRSLLLQRDIDSDTSGSWSMIVKATETKALQMLRTFAADKQYPRSALPYLSAVTPTTITISGRPGTLESFNEMFALKGRPIPVFGPYHAPHLIEAGDIESILGDLGAHRSGGATIQMPLLYGSLGRFAKRAATFRALLRHAVEDTLCRHIRWDMLCYGLSHRIQRDSSLHFCTIYPVGSNTASLLCSALKETTTLEVDVRETPAIHEDEDSATASSSKIAIIGFSGRYPEASSNEGLWEILKAAKDCYRTIPEDRFDWEAHYDPEGKLKNRSRVKYGCFINEPGLFDARFFNLSPREAENTDPAQRLALTTAYEAIEMAGLVPDRTPSTRRDRVGVFFGVTSDDWREVNSGQDVDTYFIPGGNRAFIPGRISYYFRFSGPSISVDTACSSSGAAIGTACTYLLQGECDTAVAGGANILTNPDNFVGLDRGHFLSRTGNCNPFDNSASGYCRADAVGSIVLKRLDDAIADRDPVFGVIAGSGTNHCGQTASITRPHDGDQLALFRRILRQNNVDPARVGVVEMHGTGTQAGDAAEMRSVLSAFAPTVGFRTIPLHLGAVKGSVGHSEAASGVTALIKVLLMMKHSGIPPHRLNGELNRNYPADMAQRNVHIASKLTSWRRKDAIGAKRMALVNNFSAAGGNTALLLEDAPSRKTLSASREEWGLYPVTVSAKTRQAFGNNITALVHHLDTHPDISLASLSYTTTARRIHHGFRVLVWGHDVASVRNALQRHVSTSISTSAPKLNRPAWAFTGQGVLYTGLAQQLYHCQPQFRAEIDRFNHIAQCHDFPAFLSLITGSQAGAGAAPNPIVTQLAQCCVQMALANVWRRWLGEPSAIIGHSLGEYAALYAAGVISAADAIYLVGSRARLLVERCTINSHAMLAIKAPLDTVKAVIAQCQATVSCVNGPASVVASGSQEIVTNLSGALKAMEIDSIPLDVAFAFHSAQIEPILPEFEQLARTVRYRRPNVPYLSPLLRKVVTAPDIIDAKYLVQAARDCVDFNAALDNALEDKCIPSTTPWIEIGIHPACTGMLKQIIGPSIVAVPTLRKDVDAWRVTLQTLETLYNAGADIDWNEVYRGSQEGLEVLSLPLYAWDLKNYWIQYRHNFCLTKGDDPASHARDIDPAPYISSSVHRVVEQKDGTKQSTICTETNLLDPRLTQVLTGHKVNDTQLCPSSMYADMALTIVKSMMRSIGHSDDQPGLDCSSMSIKNPLIVKGDTVSQLLRVSAVATWPERQVALDFFSVDSTGRKLSDHASCTVHIASTQQWLREWTRQAYLVKARIEMLRSAIASGDAHLLRRELTYKLFSSLVDYSSQYQGMHQVILDSAALEATADVHFQVGGDGFDCNPCWIDSLGHLAGFVMNCDLNPQFKGMVFINHGWQTMRCSKRLSMGKRYTVHNRMQLEEGTMYIGDAHIFDGEELIAVFGGVKFQGISRSVLDRLLPRQKHATGMTVTRQDTAGEGLEVHEASSVTADPAVKPGTPLSVPVFGTATRELAIKKIIAEELQVDLNELDETAQFSDLGIDSLLALTISGRLEEDLDLTVSSALFSDEYTIQALIKMLIGETPTSNDISSSDKASGSSTPFTDADQDDGYTTSSTSISIEPDIGSLLAKEPISKAEMDHPEGMQPSIAFAGIPSPWTSEDTALIAQTPHATSIVLQGSTKTATRKLFLFPDGAGSATSYAFLPRISDDVVVYGLNCPWLKRPQDFKCSLEVYVAKFLVEVRRRQDAGPYYFGGVSAGGILAYEAAQQLVAAGERVEKLVLLDTPDPVGLENPNQRMYDFLDSMGMFGMMGTKAPDWLRPHFDAFLALLDKYNVQPFLGSSPPKVHIIYAKDGMCKHEDDPRPEIRDDDPREMLWLLNNRTDFSGAGWNALVGSANIHTTAVDGVNHYTILQEGPKIAEVSKMIREALRDENAC